MLVEPRFGPDEYSAEIVDLAGGSIERLLVPGTEVEVVGRARTSADFVWIASLEKSESVIIDRRRPSSRRLVKGIVGGVVGDTVLAATLVQGQASPFVTGTANFAADPFASITQPIALAALIDETSAVVVTKDAAVHRVDLLTGDERVLSVLSVQATALSAQGGWLAAGGDNGFQFARLSPWTEVTSSTSGRQPFFSTGSRCAVFDGGLVADAQSSTVVAEFGVEGTILSPSGCTVVSATGTDAIVDGQPPTFQFSRFYDALPDDSGFVITSKAGDAAWIDADGSVVTKLPAATDYLFAEQIPAG